MCLGPHLDQMLQFGAAGKKTLRGSVFAFACISLGACTPNLAIEPLPLDVEEEATDTDAHPSVLPETFAFRAERAELRREPEDAYPLIRRRLRSSTLKRVQQ